MRSSAEILVLDPKKHNKLLKERFKFTFILGSKSTTLFFRLIMARTQILLHARDFAHHTTEGQVPQSSRRESLLHNRNIEIKTSNKNTSEFLTLSPCLKIWCFLNIFGGFRVIPASSSSAVDACNISFMKQRFSLVTRGAARGDIFARHLAAHQRIWN